MKSEEVYFCRYKITIGIILSAYLWCRIYILKYLSDFLCRKILKIKLKSDQLKSQSNFFFGRLKIHVNQRKLKK